MDKTIFVVEENKKLTDSVYKMILSGDTREIKRPGQFVDIALPGLYLRRPISVCDYDDKTLTIIYKTVGKGTEQMSGYKKGQKLEILTGLGNGYNKRLAGEKPLLVGGGVGVPPLYNLAKELIKDGKKPVFVMGFNTKSEIFYQQEFKDLGLEVYVTTVDGSYGIKGFVTDAIKEIKDYTHVYTCGPLPMLKAVYNSTTTGGSYSFEQRMGCGFGICVGCTIQTKSGAKRVCKDGPVIQKEDIIW